MADSQALLPAEIVVGFPARSAGKTPCACNGRTRWTVAVPAEDAGVDTSTYPVKAGLAVRLQSTAIAIFETDQPSGSTSDPCAEPLNAGTLRLLARAMAATFYGWRTAGYRDLRFPGTIAWELEASADRIVYTYLHPDAGGATTRVLASPYNLERELYFHATDEDRDDGHVTDWCWVITPPDGVPGNGGAGYGPYGTALCEVQEENRNTGELEPAGRYEEVRNYWTRATPGDRLIAVDVKRSPHGCYLAVRDGDCI